MGFFKETGSTTPSKTIARLQQLIWVLIYGGLLTLVLGLSVQRSDDAAGLVHGGRRRHRGRHRFCADLRAFAHDRRGISDLSRPP